jgi:N-acetylglucosamine-6-phosphate deacetylase
VDEGMKSDLIDIACEIKVETDKAILINDGTKEVWLPKSQVEINREDKEVTMPEWLAKEKELI